MSRRSSNSNTRKRSYMASRVTPVNTKTSVLRLPVSRGRISYLREFEDRRAYHPDLFTRPAVSFSRPRHRLDIKNVVVRSRSLSSSGSFHTPSLHSLPSTVAFRAPERVLVCVRRGIRKEVMFATGRAGSGRPQRRPRRSEYSDVSC